MIKSFKKENGILLSAKVITEEDILDLFKEARLYAFEICNNSCNFGFFLNNKKIKFEEINKDNVLDVLLDASFYFEDRDDVSDSYFIEHLTQRFTEVVGLDYEDDKSLFNSILEFVESYWNQFWEYSINFNDYFNVFYDKVNYLVNNHLSKEELDFFDDFIIKHNLHHSFDVYSVDFNYYTNIIFEKIKGGIENGEKC